MASKLPWSIKDNTSSTRITIVDADGRSVLVMTACENDLDNANMLIDAVNMGMMVDEEGEAQAALKPLANQFHRVNECGVIK